MSLCYGMKDGKLQNYYQEDEEELYDEESDDEESEEETEDGIILSEKYGVNPSMDLCMICGEPHQIVLLGRLPNDEEAPKQVCTGQVCSKCVEQLNEYKERLYIELSENEAPTGRYCKVPDEYLHPEYLERIGDKRILYVSTDLFAKSFNEQGTNITNN